MGTTDPAELTRAAPVTGSGGFVSTASPPAAQECAAPHCCWVTGRVQPHGARGAASFQVVADLESRGTGSSLRLPVFAVSQACFPPVLSLLLPMLRSISRMGRRPGGSPLRGGWQGHAAAAQAGLQFAGCVSLLCPHTPPRCWSVGRCHRAGPGPLFKPDSGRWIMKACQFHLWNTRHLLLPLKLPAPPDPQQPPGQILLRQRTEPTHSLSPRASSSAVSTEQLERPKVEAHICSLLITCLCFSTACKIKFTPLHLPGSAVSSGLCRQLALASRERQGLGPEGQLCMAVLLA
ncbi:uncharacterized protein LOC110347392 [Heterocephalus glaber]|uniref:Uncharacterized protein LOC110347392 n=1 Tax=Heterocephalus glaber TaxID=10181 RepID=A0AAX6SFB3_HETGA|nr:uncharacterized protein LOC110347392 [Heterocephalus glaber]